MTHLTQRILRKAGLCSQFLRLASISLALIAFQARPAIAQAPWTTPDASGNINSTNTGNVGIGTTNPLQLLHLNKTQNTNTMVLIVNSSDGGSAQTNFRAQNNVGVLSQVGVYGSGHSGYGAIAASDAYQYSSSNLVLMADGAGHVIKFTTGGAFEKMRIDASGNVGIGTTNPDLAGFGAAANRVLSLQGASQRSVLELSNAATGSSGVAGQVAYENGTTQLAATLGAADGATNSGYYAVYTNNAGSFTEKLRVDKAGNVGLGIASPQAKLHVVGDGKFTGNLTVDRNIAAKYQDLAEWVPASSVLSAGTVVTLDPTKSNHIEASSKAYDTRVAGVISEQPGIVLGERGENKVLVATTGRVRLKVDASNSPIEIGDLLVTSDIPGLAMKSRAINVGGVQIHRPGTLIGKALEPLIKGRGEILVLLSLQ